MTDTNKNIILEPDVRIYKSTSDDNNLILGKGEVNQLISDYAQPKLTAGDNIIITDNIISATDTTYSAGTGISIVDGVISNTQSSAVWGNIAGTIGDQQDLAAALDEKQNILTLPLPITSGGTGATAAAGALTNLGISDYVVELGERTTSLLGITTTWYYRKWNSGIAECWTKDYTYVQTDYNSTQYGSTGLYCHTCAYPQSSDADKLFPNIFVHKPEGATLTYLNLEITWFDLNAIPGPSYAALGMYQENTVWVLELQQFTSAMSGGTSKANIMIKGYWK